jgi:hypothetical protein
MFGLRGGLRCSTEKFLQIFNLQSISLREARSVNPQAPVRVEVGEPESVVRKKLSLRRLGLLRFRAQLSCVAGRGEPVGLRGWPTPTVEARWRIKPNAKICSHFRADRF